MPFNRPPRTRPPTATAILLGLLTLLLPLAALAAGPPAGDGLPDEAVELAVIERLFNDPGVENARIDVTVEEGVVTLSGSATNLLARDRAERLAETVKGVRAVHNRIQVNPPKRPDAAIRTAVEQALRLDPATEAYEVDVRVEGQRVILTGQVDSWGEKALAGRLAKGIVGIGELVNDIRVEIASERADSEIQHEIERLLTWDALVDSDLIAVQVDDAQVVLSGLVGSAAERRRAMNRAWVPGVRGVFANDLRVVSWTRDPRFRRKKLSELDQPDPQIAKAVRASLAVHPRTENADIEVRVDKGRAVLTGTVRDLKTKRSAERAALETLGVYRVRNLIRVQPETPTDQTIAERIREAIRNDPMLDPRDIAVTVDDGVAVLTGEADSVYEKAQADDLAARTYGVVAVDNRLRVDEIGPSNLYVDEDWLTTAMPWYAYPETVATSAKDWEIEEDVNNEIFWSPFVDSGDVRVRVDHGVVRLTGTVDSWHERQAAEENAHEGGARAVENDLKVVYGPERLSP